MSLKFLLSIFLILVSTLPSSAQEAACQPTKFALYIEVQLGSDDGLRRLYKVEELAADGGFVGTSISPEKAKAEYERRRKILVEPVLNELRSEMTVISKSNGFHLFEGLSLDEHQFLLALDDRLNVTSQLIRHFNRVSSKSGRLIADIEIPSTRIGTIDVKKLYGSSTGLRGFESATDLHLYCEDGKCKRLYDLLRKFTMDQKYGALFDSSRDLPKRIREIACFDATNEFIDYFNRNAASPE